MTLDISKIRTQTSSVGNTIHFNNAGASLMPDIVVEGMKSYIDCEAKIGGYEAASQYAKEVDLFYVNASKLINCSHEEIAFAESATIAWQRAFHSIPFVNGDIILTCVSEYASNYIAYLQLSKLKGVKIQVIPNDQNGVLDIGALENAINTKVKLISICHMPTGNGLINPAEKVGEIANKFNVMYLLDACQSIGQYPVDVQKVKCDFLSVTGRKYLRGPRGTGLLYARKKTTEGLEPQFLDLHGAEWTSSDSYQVRLDAKKYETWESNLSAKYGLTLAIDYLNQFDIKELYQKVVSIAGYLRESLRAMNHIEVVDTGINQSGIVTFVSKNHSPLEIKEYLFLNKINTSIVVASSSLFDLNERKIHEAVRASVHYFNTEEEVDFLIGLLKKF